MKSMVVFIAAAAGTRSRPGASASPAHAIGAQHRRGRRQVAHPQPEHRHMVATPGRIGCRGAELGGDGGMRRGLHHRFPGPQHGPAIRARGHRCGAEHAAEQRRLPLGVTHREQDAGDAGRAVGVDLPFRPPDMVRRQVLAPIDPAIEGGRAVEPHHLESRIGPAAIRQVGGAEEGQRRLHRHAARLLVRRQRLGVPGRGRPARSARWGMAPDPAAAPRRAHRCRAVPDSPGRGSPDGWPSPGCACPSASAGSRACGTPRRPRRSGRGHRRRCGRSGNPSHASRR